MDLVLIQFPYKLQNPHPDKVHRVSLSKEAAISCPLVCTDGLISLIEAFYEEVPEEVKYIHQHVKEGIDGDLNI